MISIGSTLIAGGVSPLPEMFGISIGVFFPFFFVGLWLFVCFVISRLGWHQFAVAYSSPIRPPGSSRSVPGAAFGVAGAARYNSVVRAIPTDEGLYLYTFILFRAFHQPFTLPWSSIERVERYTMLWTRGYILHVRDRVGGFSMHVRDGIEPELRRHIPSLIFEAA